MSNSRTTRSQVSQREAADEWVDISKLQVHHCASHQNNETSSCSVSAIPVNKVLLRELNELIGIMVLTWDFQNILGFLSEF